MSATEETIIDLDGDELLVRWSTHRKDAVALLRIVEGVVVLDVEGIAKLRATLDRAEAAYHARKTGSS